MRTAPRGLPTVCALLAAAWLPAGARAAGADGGEGPTPPPRSLIEGSAATGTFSPLSHAAAVGSQQAFVVTTGGYDSARQTGLFEATAEARVVGPVAIRGGAVYTTGDRKLKPTFGAHVQLLREARHGLDGSLGVFYKPEGLTEPEGEIEAVVAAGAHLGRTYLLGNLVYGQDGEGNERDGEARLAALHPLAPSLLVGLDTRVRFDLGSRAAVLAGKGEPTLDVLAGPSATWLVGRMALLVHGGASALRASAGSAVGAFVMGGMGSAF